MRKTIHRTYKFALKPDKKQIILLEKHLGSTRFVYNYFLNERITQYEDSKKSDNYVEQARKLTMLKKESDRVWLKEVNSQALQFALKSIEVAYKNFFRGNARFPRFKSKRHKSSFTIPQHVKLEYGRLRFPKFNDGVKVIIHRRVKGEIGKCTISRTPTGKYFVSIFTLEDYEPKRKTNRAVGCDLGIKELLVTSDNRRFENYKYTKKYEKKLALAQRMLSRKKKGSRSFEKQRRKVALIHEKIYNARADNLHKITTELIRRYDIIAIEDLNVKGMIKNKRLSKHIADASFGFLRRLLEYKAKWNDKVLVVVDKFFPSSKKCSICSEVNHETTLSDRIFVCQHGHTLCRDLNAAINLLKEGIRIIGAGLSDYTSGESVRSYIAQLSGKLEAHPSVS